MIEEELLRTEGDINLSSRRNDWQSNYVSQEAMQILEEDSTYFLHQSMSSPCLNVLRSSEGIYIEDIDGRKYMDFHGNNVHQVGYKNQFVINAIIEQLQTLPFSPRRYTNDKAIMLAKKLAQLSPSNLNKVLFAPGGTEAIGMALKLTRFVTGKHKTISMWDSFHGASLDAISVGGEAVFRKGIGPLLSGTEHAIPFNSYRCILGECSTCPNKCLDYLDFMLSREGDVGAVILETIRNTDVQVPPVSYYKRLREICDKHEVLLILDEIPIALGRTGKMFAIEHYGIAPDMIVIGKGLGGGIFPMASLIVREDLDQANEISLGHYTHEKSAVGCAAALATIEYIEKEDLLNHVSKLEVIFRKRLEEMKNNYSIIGDIRGVGLLFAIELVKDPVSKEKAIEEAEIIMYQCMEKGLSFKISQGNVLTLSPPLTISGEELEKALTIIESSIKNISDAPMITG
ncbi:aspartate aminotransferase family protein [Priestia megaterium]